MNFCLRVTQTLSAWEAALAFGEDYDLNRMAPFRSLRRQTQKLGAVQLLGLHADPGSDLFSERAFAQQRICPM